MMLTTLFVMVSMAAVAEGLDGQDGGWTGWTAWSECTSTCGGGLKTRGRSCTNPTPEGQGKYCMGDGVAVVVCGDGECPVPELAMPIMAHFKNTSCNDIYNPGGWSEWSNWTACSATCGGGVTLRDRKCDHPAPGIGGKYCIGDRHDTSRCNVDPCDSGTDGSWSTWSDWSRCTRTCGGGVHVRTRSCDDPAPVANGRYCRGDDEFVGVCNVRDCPDTGSTFVAFTVSSTKVYRPKEILVIPMDRKIYNNGGHFNYHDNMFYAPAKGYYLFTFSAVGAGYGTHRHQCDGTWMYHCMADLLLYTRKQGSTAHKLAARAVSDGGGYAYYNQAAGSVIIEMEFNETASLWAYKGWLLGTDATVGANMSTTYFSGLLLQVTL